MATSAHSQSLREPTDAETLQRLFGDRHSCRAFRDQPVDRSIITRILELAQLSPSWCNTQPWQVAVTEGQGTQRLRDAIRAFAVANDPRPDVPFPSTYPGVYDERRKVCGWQLYESVGIERGDREASASQALRNFELFGAPHVAIVSTAHDLGVYGAIDCGVYLAHFLLAAQSLGVATIPQAALAAVSPVIREELGLDDSRQVLFGVSFGYPDVNHAANGFRTARAGIEEVLRWVS